MALAGLVPAASMAQSTLVVTENFTGGTTNNSWYYINGACLTAGSLLSTATASPGFIPACQIGSTLYPYYVTNFAMFGNVGAGDAQLDGGDTGALPDTVANGGGALRLTNDSYGENGAIISNFSFPLSSEGLSVTFTTETYAGDSGGSGGDGADGISFFLQDASVATPTLGDWGGSLGYTCSNVNNSATQGYDGMIGAYIGLGIDEYGNFLNGTVNSTSSTPTYNGGADNTSSGYGYVWNRVGLRGQGSTAWVALNTNAATSAYYPSALNAAQRAAAVRLACQSGIAWNWSAVTPATPAGGGSTTVAGNSFSNPYNALPVPTVTLPNYAAIPGAYKILSTQIANEDANLRGYATPATTGDNYGIPITYQLNITTAGLLSLAYSYNGGAYNQILSGQSILTSNGALPANVRFGFAGSTGGSNNIHEIMCFQAAPQTSSASSAGINLKQTAKVQTGTQVYFAFYNANNWTGSLTSNYLIQPPGDPNVNDLEISPTVNWDASCVLTGVLASATCASTGVAGLTNPETPSSRVMLTWSGAAGEPFEAPSPGPGVTAAQLTALNTEGGPYTSTSDVLNYLRGVRTFENSSYGGGEFRQRTSVLGDIIDSSPTWVGPPQEGYPAAWTDKLYSAQVPAENSGQTYTTYASSTGAQLRENVVYSGANDGFMHGYRTGSFDSSNAYITTSYANDGEEVFAYMPGYVLNLINSYTTDPNSDYANIQYAHQFSVDGTPGTGDLFYGGAWHTWMVAGLGFGGPAVYALDITNPTNFTEGNASSLVIGEWSVPITTTTTTTKTCTKTVAGVCTKWKTTTTTTTGASPTFTCVGNTTCGNNMGNTYGVPQIRRFHNGQWGAVLGNGFNSATGDAGIFIMLVPTSGTPSTSTINLYYISTSTGSAGSPNGIAYVTPADLDGDHVVDYVYAGDLQGNVWRFDLTGATPATWASAAPYKVYTTGTATAAGDPISTKVVVASVPGPGTNSTNPRVLIEFGTGLHTPFSNSAPDTYQTGQQYLFGVWDWNLTTWNGESSTLYDALPATTPAVPGFASSTGPNVMEQQTITGTYDASLNASSATSTSSTAFSYRTVSSSAICWADLTSCATTPEYGWYLGLAYGHANPYDANGPSTTANTADTMVYEQVLFNPTLVDGAFIVNTTIPPTSSLATCASTPPGGWTMAINPATGGAFTTSFFADSGKNFLNINNQAVEGVALNGTGSGAVVAQGNSTYFVTQTSGPSPLCNSATPGCLAQINPPGNVTGSRLTWIQRR
jgi:type IV pilus assembly protein PilY1